MEIFYNLRKIKKWKLPKKLYSNNNKKADRDFKTIPKCINNKIIIENKSRMALTRLHFAINSKLKFCIFSVYN